HRFRSQPAGRGDGIEVGAEVAVVADLDLALRACRLDRGRIGDQRRDAILHGAVVRYPRIEGDEEAGIGRHGLGQPLEGLPRQRGVEPHDAVMAFLGHGLAELDQKAAVADRAAARKARHQARSLAAGRNGAMTTPASSSPARTLRAIATAPALSPWTQTDWASSGIALPSIVGISPVDRNSTSRAAAAAGSWIIAPSRERGTSRPVARQPPSAKTPLKAAGPMAAPARSGS